MDQLKLPSYNLDHRRELFVDDYLCEERKNLDLRVHTPVHRFDTIGRIYGHYQTVMHDGEKFCCYARTHIDGLHNREDCHSGEAYLYAESIDGLRWKRPRLNLFPAQDENDFELQHSIITHDTFGKWAHNFSPFYDNNPACPEHERYKATAGILSGVGDLYDPQGGISLFTSPDGIHWSRLGDKPVIVFEDRFGLFAFDSQNYAFYSQDLQKYVMYFRVRRTKDCTDEQKSFAWSVSDDFINWEPPQMVNTNRPGEHIYVTQFNEYSRAPHYLIGMPTRWYEFRNEATDIGLMFARAGEAPTRPAIGGWIRPGMDAVRWENRMNYMARGLFNLTPEELTFYPALNEGRYTIRTDGFMSLHSDLEMGEWLSIPLRYRSGMPEFNLSTGLTGTLQVEFRDAQNRVLPGFSFEDNGEIYGDAIDMRPAWKKPLPLQPGEYFRMCFRLSDGDLYSFKFTD